MREVLPSMEGSRTQEDGAKMKNDNVEAWVLSISVDTVTYYGSSAENVLKQLKMSDWSIPSSVFEYKTRAAQRAQVLGYHLVFWDATSFILAAQSAGLLTVRFNPNNVKNSSN